MEQALDAAITNRTLLRQDLQHAEDQAHEGNTTDAELQAYDALTKNEGAVQMGLRMIAIMRSTTTKTELKRARTRLTDADE